LFCLYLVPLLYELLKPNFFLLIRQNGFGHHSGGHASGESAFLAAPAVLHGEDAASVGLLEKEGDMFDFDGIILLVLFLYVASGFFWV
jgi:hypothetical protein